MGLQKIRHGIVQIDTGSPPAGSTPAATTLTSNINATVTDIPLADTSNVVDGTYLTIADDGTDPSEQVLVQSHTATDAIVVRAASATPHNSGTAVTLPGSVSYQLLLISDQPNKKTIVHKSTADGNYVKILAAQDTGGNFDHFPGGGTSMVLADSHPVTLVAPQDGSRVWIVIHGSGAGATNVSGGGGGSQTPWLTDVDAAQHNLHNATLVTVAGDGTAGHEQTLAMLPYEVVWYNLGNLRWALAQVGAESGVNNTGSDLHLFAYKDDGTFLRTQASFIRGTGETIFNADQGLEVNTLAGYGIVFTTDYLSVSGSGGVQCASVQVKGSAINSNQGYYYAYQGGSPRWFWGKTPTAESAPAGGSDWVLGRYDNTGAYLGQPIFVKRSNGYIGLNGANPAYPLDITGDVNVTGVYRVNGVPIGGATNPGGFDQSIQFRQEPPTAGVFQGDGNLKWDYGNQVLRVTAKTGAPLGLKVISGYVDADGGYLTTDTDYNAIQATKGGVFACALGITTTAAGAGGYIDIPPNSLSNTAICLPPATFGTDHILLWSAQALGTNTTITTYALCCNAGIRSQASFLSANTGVAAFQSDAGGATLGMGVYLKGHANSGNANGLNLSPAGYGALGFQAGSSYWYWDAAGAGAWKIIDFNAAAQASPPGGFDQSIQYRKEPPAWGSFQGDGNLKWDYGNQVMTIIAKPAAGTPPVPNLALKIQAGYVESDIGYYTSNSSYQAVKVSFGGVNCAGLGIATSGGKGGYIDLPPQATYPVALTNASLPDTDVILWASGVNNTATPNTSSSLCINAGVRAAASFITTEGGTAAFFAPGSAMLGKSVFLAANGTAPATGGAGYGGFAYKSGSTYWYLDTAVWKSIDFTAVAGLAPGGSDQSIQYRNAAGAFTGDANLKWNYTTQAMTIIAKTPAPSVGLKVQTGYIDSDGGYYTSNTGYTAIQAPAGGLFSMGLGITSSASQGGYIDIPVLGGAKNFPVALNNASFVIANNGDVLLWTAPSNGTTTPVTAYTLCTNAGVTAAAAFISQVNGAAAFVASTGGAVLGQGVYLFGRANTTGLSDAPNGYGGLSWQSGAVYYYWNGTGWATVNLSATGGVPGGNAGNVQYNTGPGTFAGSDNLSWNNSSRLLTVNAAAGTAAISAASGYIQSTGGYLVTATNTAYNTIQTSGGIVALGRICVLPALTPDLGSGLTGVTGLFVTLNATNAFLIDAYDTSGGTSVVTGFIGRRAAYTGTPGIGNFQNLASGVTLASLGGRGSTTNGFTGSATASMTFVTSEGWTLAANGTEISFNVTPNGQLTRYAKMWLHHAGQLEITGQTTDTAANNARSIGVLLNNGNFRAADPNGAAYMMTQVTSSANLPAFGGVGGIAYAGGANYWLFNGSVWVSVSLTTSVSSILGGTGVTVSGTTAVTINIGQDVSSGASPTWNNITANGVLQSSSTGITFQNSGGVNFQVNRAGVVSCQELDIAGIKCVGSDRLWVQSVQTSGHVFGGDFGILGSFVGGNADIVIAGVGTLHFVGGLFKNLT